MSSPVDMPDSGSMVVLTVSSITLYLRRSPTIIALAMPGQSAFDARARGERSEKVRDRGGGEETCGDGGRSVGRSVRDVGRSGEIAHLDAILHRHGCYVLAACDGHGQHELSVSGRRPWKEKVVEEGVSGSQVLGV